MAPAGTILIAEDSESDAILIEEGFASARVPFSVRFVRDGSEAVSYLQGQNKFADRRQFPIPFILLTDLQMPRMDGFELLQWVRRSKAFHTLPVIVVTGSDESEDRARALSLGAEAYVTKDLLLRPPASLVDAIFGYATVNRNLTASIVASKGGGRAGTRIGTC